MNMNKTITSPVGAVEEGMLVDAVEEIKLADAMAEIVLADEEEKVDVDLGALVPMNGKENLTRHGDIALTKTTFQINLMGERLLLIVVQLMLLKFNK